MFSDNSGIKDLYHGSSSHTVFSFHGHDGKIIITLKEDS